MNKVTKWLSRFDWVMDKHDDRTPWEIRRDVNNYTAGDPGIVSTTMKMGRPYWFESSRQHFQYKCIVHRYNMMTNSGR